AFWIVALYRALHGGDPALADVAASVIANLWRFLPATEEASGLPPLPIAPAASPTRSDSDPDDSGEDEPETSPEPADLLCYDPREFSFDYCYFESKGVFFRLDRPTIACLPTAA